MAKDNIIPDMTIAEASEFWDEHEFDEFSDVEEVHDVQIIAPDCALSAKEYQQVSL